MIHCNLSVLLAERQLKISQAAADTGISRTTLTALARNNCQGIQMATLNTLCFYLGIRPDDLFSFHPYDLVLEEIQGQPEQFQALYRVRSSLSSALCTLAGSASITEENGTLTVAAVLFRFANQEDHAANQLFTDAFRSLSPAFKNDLEVALFKEFITQVSNPGAPVGTSYKVRFVVQWPSL